MSETMHKNQNVRNRLIYRANYRGTKEMDLLVGTFAKAYVPEMSDTQLSEFEDFLNEEDPDLYTWFYSKENVPEEKMTSVMKMFLEYDYSV